MSYLTEDEENTIDTLERGCLKLDRGNRTFTIKGTQIYCYGEIDLTKQEDIDNINNLGFLDYLGGVGKRIPANYDYFTHTAKSPIRKYLFTEVFTPIEIVKFVHASLNKPKRVIIFTQN